MLGCGRQGRDAPPEQEPQQEHGVLQHGGLHGGLEVHDELQHGEQVHGGLHGGPLEHGELQHGEQEHGELQHDVQEHGGLQRGGQGHDELEGRGWELGRGGAQGNGKLGQGGGKAREHDTAQERGMAGGALWERGRALVRGKEGRRERGPQRWASRSLRSRGRIAGKQLAGCGPARGRRHGACGQTRAPRASCPAKVSIKISFSFTQDSISRILLKNLTCLKDW